MGYCHQENCGSDQLCHQELTRIRKMEKKKGHLKQLLKACTLCGSCNSSCPVYGIELTEPYSPRGKINLVKEFMDGNIKSGKETRELISVCLICNYCQNSCSKGVDFRSIFSGYISMVEDINNDNDFD